MCVFRNSKCLVPPGLLGRYYFAHFAGNMLFCVQVEYHEKEVLRFVDNVNSLEHYRGVKLLQQPKDGITEAAAKMFAR